jgi:Family of unknown function (DUF6788)
MAANDERQLARLRARFHDKAQELPELGFLIRGSIIERFSRCGSAGCGCHDDPPRLHGPYWQWTAKIKGKTVTRNLSEEQVKRYRAWMDNAQRVDQVVSELYEISAEADQILRGLEREAAPPRKKKQKKRQKPSRPAPRS